jgi:hypothetical protein
MSVNSAAGTIENQAYALVSAGICRHMTVT